MKTTKSNEDWIDEYGKVRPSYVNYCKKLKILFDDLLLNSSLKYHTIEGRTKTIESFSDKLSRAGKNYKYPLQEITDLCGLRIIVFYEDDIDKVCALIDKEFNVDEVKSIDKRALLNVDQLGYLSVHKIVSLSDERAKLSEWSIYKEYISEIQVRSVLQHAWSVISHSLLYKRESDVPYQMRRKLLRLSGLLELADEEFTEVRNNQTILEREISENILKRELNIPINLISVKEFITTFDAATEIIENAYSSGFEELVDEIEDFEEKGYSDLVTACELSNLKHIEDLKNNLISVKQKSKIFFKEFLRLETLPAASPSHILSIIIIAIHSEKIELADVLLKFEWVEEYVENIYLAAKKLKIK
jgi:ppGpp synthetase/RelA/SpoT-type nucleotidyltranferase